MGIGFAVWFRRDWMLNPAPSVSVSLRPTPRVERLAFGLLIGGLICASKRREHTRPTCAHDVKGVRCVSGLGV